MNVFYLNCKHVPLKIIKVVNRPLFEWMTDNILALKAICLKNEFIWRKNRITINFNIYYDSCMAVKKAISKRKADLPTTQPSMIAMEARFTIFGASRPCGPAGWLALLIIKAGDKSRSDNHTG